MTNLDLICGSQYIIEDEYSYLEISFSKFRLAQNGTNYLLSFSEIRTNQIFQLDFSNTVEWRKEYFINKDNISSIEINTVFNNNDTVVKISGNDDFRLEISGYLDNQYQKHCLSVKEIDLNLKNYFDAINLINRLLNPSKKINFLTLN